MRHMSVMNTALLPRPHSCDHPRVAGFEPLIRTKIERVSRTKRKSWRCQVMVNDCPMAISHHDTKTKAESHGAKMIEAYSAVHYWQS